MDKEMMGKVNELLKANGKRELSLDEMDKVSGGVDGIYGVDGHYYTEPEILAIGRTTAENLGYNVAAEVLCGMFMMDPSEIKKHNHSTNSADAVGDIDAFISQMFNIYDRIEKTGHSY